MNKETQKALEAAGFIVGDAEEFPPSSNAEERDIVDLRVRLAHEASVKSVKNKI